MGVNNATGRQNKCGSGVIMYTYPAWTFPGKRKGTDATPGPGPGNFVPGTEMGATGPSFGPPPYRGGPTIHGAAALGPLTKPGTISAERKPPSWSFGSKHPYNVDNSPGPQAYRPLLDMVQTAHPAPGWGPPSRQRPASVPREMRRPETPTRKTIGPSFGLPFRPAPDYKVPGPLAYQPNCAGCCMACDSTKGTTMGLRPPTYYGKKVGGSPGPANYHVECSTIGAATQNCETGSSTFRRFSKRS